MMYRALHFSGSNQWLAWGAISAFAEPLVMQRLLSWVFSKVAVFIKQSTGRKKVHVEKKTDRLERAAAAHATWEN